MKRIINRVWSNLDRAGSRYVPRANGTGPGAWSVFDKLEGRMLSEREVRLIDATENLEN